MASRSRDRPTLQYHHRPLLVLNGLCPAIHWPVLHWVGHWSGRCRLLTMERLHGVPLTDLAAIRSMTSADPEQTLITALNTWFGSVLGCETFHADVHAGTSAAPHYRILPHVLVCRHAFASAATHSCGYTHREAHMTAQPYRCQHAIVASPSA